MSAVLSLPAKMNTAAAEQLVADLRSVDGNFVLDATETTYVGALCMQALVAASRHAATTGASFEITGVSEAVEQQFAVMGVSPKNLMEAAI